MNIAISRGLAASLLGLAVWACSEEPSQPSASQESEAAAASTYEDDGAVIAYREVRELLAKGDVVAAAQLSDDPARFEESMQRLFDGVGSELAQVQFADAAQAPIRLSRSDRGYSMVIVETGDPRSPVAAEFFRQSSDGVFKQMVAPSDELPCSLVKSFYEEKGEPEAEYSCTP